MTLRLLAATVVSAALSTGCQPSCSEGRICAVMGDGELGFNGDGNPALKSRLASPTSVGVDPDGRIYVVDYSNMRIRTLQDDGTLLTTVGSGTHAYSEIGVAPLDTPLENPVDAQWGTDGRLYILPQHEGRMIYIDDTDRVKLCVGTGVLADTGDGGPALEAELGYGSGMALGSDGSIFVSDSSFSRVRRVDPAGTITTVLGTGSGEFGPVGYGPETPVRSPERLFLDEDRDRLIVADTLNHRVLAVDLTTLQATLIAGTGERGYLGDGGPGSEAQLDYPTGVTVAPSGAVIIGDLGNDVLRRVDPDGTITTVAGVQAEDDPRRSGPAEDFPMRGPAGMAWVGSDLLIAERSGHRVLRWNGAVDAL